jgi:hypothetical protein
MYPERKTQQQIDQERDEVAAITGPILRKMGLHDPDDVARRMTEDPRGSKFMRLEGTEKMDPVVAEAAKLSVALSREQFGQNIGGKERDFGDEVADRMALKSPGRV